MIECDNCGKEIGTDEEIMDDRVEAHRVERNNKDTLPAAEVLCKTCYHKQPQGSLREDEDDITFNKAWSVVKAQKCRRCGHDTDSVPPAYKSIYTACCDDDRPLCEWCAQYGCRDCEENKGDGATKYEGDNGGKRMSCSECYGTGGLYDSHMGIDDVCVVCEGTGEEVIE